MVFVDWNVLNDITGDALDVVLGCLSLLILDVNLLRGAGASNDLFWLDNDDEVDTVGILFALLTDILLLTLLLMLDDKLVVDLLLLFIILGCFKFEGICIDGDLSWVLEFKKVLGILEHEFVCDDCVIDVLFCCCLVEISVCLVFRV